MFRRPATRLATASPRGLAAVLLERDGTLIEDVPYNGDPARVRPVPGARSALERLRAHGVRVGVLTTEGGISRGLLTHAAVETVHRRVEELVGGVDVWQLCVHGPGDGCHCRAPAPGLVLAAARRLGVPPSRCVVIGGSAAETAAARLAGATSVLVRTPATRADDLAAATNVASDLCAAVDWALRGAPAVAGAR